MANSLLKRIQHRLGMMNPPQLIVFSFATIIGIGTILLLLPGTMHEGSLSFVDALFTSVSATCVTGLTVVDIGTQFTQYGQIVVLALIQVGGLGIMTFSTFFLYLFGRRLSMRGRDVIGSTLSHEPVQDIRSLLRKVMLLVFLFEGIGAGLLSVAWLKYHPLPKALYHGVFHSISAFCNAGFSLYSTSFEIFQTDVAINIVVMGLIILGGLGFVVLIDLKHVIRGPKTAWRRLSFHTKVVLSVTGALILIGTLFILVVEYRHIFHGVNIFEASLMSLFQSVTARTAGFNTLNMGAMTNGACLIIMFLMFIGAAPGSCGGGVKVSTLGILVAMLLARYRGAEEPHLFHRSITRETSGKALTIVISAVMLIGIVFLTLLLSEDWFIAPDESRTHFIELLFETISAFGTVGLSMGVTAKLTIVGRLLIIALMFIGRLGPLTMAVALTSSKPKGRYRYARGEIMVG